jgi:hypothetical protein
VWQVGEGVSPSLDAIANVAGFGADVERIICGQGNILARQHQHLGANDAIFNQVTWSKSNHKAHAGRNQRPKYEGAVSDGYCAVEKRR